LERKALRATGVISARLAGEKVACFELSARGVKAFAERTGAAAALAGGEDGAPTEAVSETLLVVLEMEAWRGREAGRLERNP
jgi:hypothetical protein